MGAPSSLTDNEARKHSSYLDKYFTSCDFDQVCLRVLVLSIAVGTCVSPLTESVQSPLCNTLTTHHPKTLIAHHQPTNFLHKVLLRSILKHYASLPQPPNAATHNTNPPSATHRQSLTGCVSSSSTHHHSTSFAFSTCPLSSYALASANHASE